VVSTEKIEAGRFIDTPDFPKLGYIPTVPALEIRSLEAVISDAPKEPKGIAGQNGENAVPMISNEHTVRTIHIEMTPDDSRRLGVITEQAVGKQILVMLGDEPLVAARVLTPITTQYLQLSFHERHDGRRIEDAIRALTAKR
jgi:hypothetical protein